MSTTRLTYASFLDEVIERGMEGAKRDYPEGKKLEGSLKGFEECRGLTPEELKELMEEAIKARKIAYAGSLERTEEKVEEYWYWRCRESEIEWVCNVVSAMLANQGLDPLVPPTARGVQMAANILGPA